MQEDELIERYPRVFHVADPGAWSSMVEHGLLSTSALLDLHGVTGTAREAIEARPRRQDHRLSRDGLPSVVIRDQRPLLPLRDTHLDDGLTVADWCRILNRRVYLFTVESDATRLVAAYPGQHVYTVSTAKLIQAHRDHIRLAGINTGYAMRRPARRGLQTFQSIHAFEGRVKEFTVEWSIPDLAELVGDTP